METCQVIKSYVCEFPDPLILRKGDTLTTSGHESIFSGKIWLWCTTPAGKGGWVPQNYLKREGDQRTLCRDYDATELTVETGDRLTILDEESGWVWCLTQDGLHGWVPAENVQRL